ncbi:MAG: hypothetical protein ACM3L6_06805 [Deltaproteobacteria bacterium]
METSDAVRTMRRLSLSGHRLKKAAFPAALLILHIGLGLVFGRAFVQFTRQGFRPFQLKMLDIYNGAHLVIPRRQPYILKLWGDDPPARVSVNDKTLPHFLYRDRPTIKEFYYFLPPTLTWDGKLDLRIEPAIRFSMKLRNNVAESDFGSILLRSTRGRTPAPRPSPFVLTAFALVFLLIGAGWAAFSWRLGFMRPARLLTALAWCYAPSLFILGFLSYVESVLPVRFVFHPASFLGFLLCAAILAQMPGLLRIFLATTSGLIWTRVCALSKENADRIMATPMFKYVARLGLAKRLILLSAFFLLVSLLALTARISFLAEFFANLTYISLLAFAVIKLFRIRGTT